MPDLDLSQSIGDAVGEAWSTLFTKSVGLSASEGVDADALDLEAGLVSATLNISGDLSGSARLLLDKTDALTMVGMMLSMGADDALIDSTREGELGDEEIDALKEALNQFCGTAATILRDHTGGAVQLELGDLITLDSAPESEAGEKAVVYDLSLEGYNTNDLILILENSLEEALSAGNALSGDDIPQSAAEAADAPSGDRTIDKLAGLSTNVDLVLAERSMELEQLLKLSVGHVVEFWKPCDHPAELYIQNTPVASGEVVLCQNQHFGIRVLNIAPKRKVYEKGAG